MKNWKPLLILVLVIAVLFTVGYLYDKGILRFKWQWLTVLVAALAAPYHIFMRWLKGNKSTVQEITDQHAAVRQQEAQYRQVIEDRIKDREQRVALMEKDIALLDARLDLLKAKKDQVDKDVKSLSIDDKIKEFKDAFGR